MCWIEDAIESDIDDLKIVLVDKIKSDLENQPYSVKCKECGEDLKFTMSLDYSNDIYIVVEPCSCGRCNKPSD